MQNGRLCRIQGWRHRAKTLCDRVAGSAPEERGGGGGGAQVGAEETSFGRTESETTPAFYAQDGALGWRLCHLGLEGTFSHKWANKRNVSPPRMHSSESECGRHFSMGGGDPIGGILRATSLYTVNAGRQITAGPCILFTRGTRRTLINCDQWEASVGCNDYGLTGPLFDHARGTDSFVCVCFFIGRIVLYCIVNL